MNCWCKEEFVACNGRQLAKGDGGICNGHYSLKHRHAVRNAPQKTMQQKAITLSFMIGTGMYFSAESLSETPEAII